MRLLSLQLEQFRNYGSLSLAFDDRSVQLFVGSNGSGKTNILESIGMLSYTKSFLGVDDNDLRQWGTEFYRVKAQAVNDQHEGKELEIVSQILPRKQKACFRNGVRVSFSDVIGELPTVLFLPQDLSLFSGPPSERRRFLDQILSQVSPEYFLTLMEYQKLLKQRNALLRSIKDGSASVESLDVWDKELAARGSVLILRRLELMETFTLTLGDEVRSLGETWERVSIVYERTGTARTKEDVEIELIGLLEDHRERDIILQTTLSGPHRDDWHLSVDGHPLQSFASRGQQRIAVLSLLFLEASYLEIRRGERPIVLLDDIFSELDDLHRERVMSAFRDHQVFMTATHVPPGTSGSAVWDVTAGKVERMSMASA